MPQDRMYWRRGDAIAGTDKLLACYLYSQPDRWQPQPVLEERTPEPPSHAPSSQLKSFFLPGPAGRLEAMLNSGRPKASHAALVCHPHPLLDRKSTRLNSSH